MTNAECDDVTGILRRPHQVQQISCSLHCRRSHFLSYGSAIPLCSPLSDVLLLTGGFPPAERSVHPTCTGCAFDTSLPRVRHCSPLHCTSRKRSFVRNAGGVYGPAGDLVTPFSATCVSPCQRAGKTLARLPVTLVAPDTLLSRPWRPREDAGSCRRPRRELPELSKITIIVIV